jgi:diacylglycerol O-acyltransferase
LFASLSDFTQDELIKNFRENFFGTREAKPVPERKFSVLHLISSLIANFLFYGWLFCAAIYMGVKYIIFLFFTNEAKTVLKTGKLSQKKSLCWIHPDELIPISECSQIGKKFKSTINDVMVSCLLGAMEAYMDKYQFGGKEPPKEILQVGISILANMRDPRVLMYDGQAALDLIYKPGNKVGFMATRAPIYGIHDPVKRLKAVTTQLSTVKNSGERFLSYYASNLIWMLPQWSISSIWDLLLGGVTLVVSNVRGLSGLVIGGRKLKNSLGFVPGTGSGEIAALVLSSSGYLNMCLNCNSTAVKDTKFLMKCFLDEYKALKLCAEKA